MDKKRKCRGGKKKIEAKKSKSRDLTLKASCALSFSLPSFALSSIFYRFIIVQVQQHFENHNQQREPFRQFSEPAVTVIVPTREDGLALRLEALA